MSILETQHATSDLSLDRVDQLLRRPLPAGAETLLAELAARTDARRAVYMSTPITTGPRYLEWRISTTGLFSDEHDAYARELKQQVIDENLSRVKPLLARLQNVYSGATIIDPTALEMPDWEQSDYHRYWAEVITGIVDVAVFADGWQYSTGCAVEYAVAIRKGIPCLDSGFRSLSPEHAHGLLSVAAQSLAAAGLPSEMAESAARSCLEFTPKQSRPMLKDDRLNALAREFNVARFVSFGPDVRLRHAVIGMDISWMDPTDTEGIITQLLDLSTSGSVNIRTFTKDQQKSGPFEYGLRSASVAAETVVRFARDGLFTIVNETIDIHDGGVSGVSLGGLVEFAPDDTPRSVEKPGTASLPIDAARHLLSDVYGVTLEIPREPTQRYEFSVHPRRVGHRESHMLLWEAEEVASVDLPADVRWPNRFSRMLGDKTYGLLVAHVNGARVPLTRVFGRRVAPFEFGSRTGTNEWWLRTCPAEQTPGHFTTTSTWIDPFKLLAQEDPEGHIAAVLSQESVDAVFSGASVPLKDGNSLIEGVRGAGDHFMLGQQGPTELPGEVVHLVSDVIERLAARIGLVRTEWAFDGADVWVLQLHRSRETLESNVVSPGDAESWLDFDVREGLQALHHLIEKARATASGISVHGHIGVTSHVGDLLRKAAIPARIAR